MRDHGLTEHERARLERAFGLKPGACAADEVRMTNSVPPPSSTPERPLTRKRGFRGSLIPAGLAAAAIAAAGLFYATTSTSCVTNGAGTEMCGGDAIAYCDGLAARGQLIYVTGDPGAMRNYKLCIGAGWDDPNR